jgi:ribosomal protein S18 acetylase RimI-like enzyme
MTIRFHYSTNGIEDVQLRRLRAEWLNPPSTKTFLASLKNMAVVLALDEESGDVVGFACGLTDHTLILYIWDIEVVPEQRGLGLERDILRRFIEKFGQLYQVNCHPGIQAKSWFEDLGFRPYTATEAVAMTLMRHAWQDGGPHALVS